MASQVPVTAVVLAIKTTLGAAAMFSSGRAVVAADIGESIPITPLLQVYPDLQDTDAGEGGNDRSSFRAGLRQHSLVIFADFYAHKRANIGEDFGHLLTGWEQLNEILEAQDTAPLFGLIGANGKGVIKAFKYSIKRIIFTYNANDSYMGARITITTRLF